MVSETDMRTLIKAAICAPSADNMQPWKFRYGANYILLYHDRGLMGHFFDPSEVATQMGSGAVIENIAQAARKLGITSFIELKRSDSKDLVAKVTFAVTENGPSGGLSEDDVLFKRCTDRSIYRWGKKIPDVTLDLLSRVVDECDGFHFTRYDETVSRKQIIRAVYAADTIRFNHQRVHEDFYNVLRFGGDGVGLMDGLAENTLGVESIFIPILKVLKPWSLTRKLNLIGLHKVMALRGTWLPMKSTPHIVSIVHCGSPDYFDAGRVMQRFWLEATNAGLSLQPLGALPLFLARLELMGGEGFGQSHICQLQRLQSAVARITPAYKQGESQLIMLFRVGYAHDKPARSQRRPLESFLI